MYAKITRHRISYSISSCTNRVTKCQSQQNELAHVATGRPLNSRSWFFKQSLVMGLSSAVLGPFCDGQHSAHDVLHYTHPIHLELIPKLVTLDTTWWTPILFALAGIILGTAHPILDSIYPNQKPRGGFLPSWSFVLLCISLFVCQYGLSAVLNDPSNTTQLSGFYINAILAATGIGLWYVFDRTKQGLFMACLTAAAGPAVESFLISRGLYSYEHTDGLLNIPLWICWVYFCGAPAVGNLGRVIMPATVDKVSDT